MNITPLFSTSSAILKRLPPLPPLLRWGLLAAHYLPAAVLYGLGLSLLLSSPAPSTLQLWIATAYQISPLGYGIVTAIFALASIVLAKWPGHLKRLPMAEFFLTLVLTFPLILYILSAWWFSAIVQPQANKVFVFLYTAVYVCMVVLYAVSAGFRLWFGALSTWASGQQKGDAN